MDEKLDVLDDFGRSTGEVAYKSEAHRRGLWHRCFHCWVAAADESGPYLLLQRRAAGKDTWPGRLDVTAAGHLKSGEGVLEGGMRELWEELGLSVEAERLVPLGTRRIEQEIPGGRDREFHEVFLVVDFTPAENLKLQRGEVDAVLLLRFDDAERLDGGASVPAVEFAGGRGVPTRVSLPEFVPNPDDYLRRVARAAGRVLAGDRSVRVF